MVIPAQPAQRADVVEPPLGGGTPVPPLAGVTTDIYPQYALEDDAVVIWEEIEIVEDDILTYGLEDYTTVETRADGATVVKGEGSSIYANSRGVNLATQGEVEYLTMGPAPEGEEIVMGADPKREEVKAALDEKSPLLSVNRKIVPPGLKAPSRSYGGIAMQRKAARDNKGGIGGTNTPPPSGDSTVIKDAPDDEKKTAKAPPPPPPPAKSEVRK